MQLKQLRAFCMYFVYMIVIICIVSIVYMYLSQHTTKNNNNLFSFHFFYSLWCRPAVGSAQQSIGILGTAIAFYSIPAKPDFKDLVQSSHKHKPRPHSWLCTLLLLLLPLFYIQSNIPTNRGPEAPFRSQNNRIIIIIIAIPHIQISIVQPAWKL